MEQTLNLSNLVALFLAEAIRSRRTSLSRAAEISHRVIAKLPFIKSEDQALSILTGIEKDFEEVSALKQALHFGYQASDIKVYETEIKQYASTILAKDLNLSNQFLQDAAAPGTTIQTLCVKYPEFSDYLKANSEDAAAVEGMREEERKKEVFSHF